MQPRDHQQVVETEVLKQRPQAGVDPAFVRHGQRSQYGGDVGAQGQRAYSLGNQLSLPVSRQSKRGPPRPPRGCPHSLARADAAHGVDAGLGVPGLLVEGTRIGQAPGLAEPHRKSPAVAGNHFGGAVIGQQHPVRPPAVRRLQLPHGEFEPLSAAALGKHRQAWQGGHLAGHAEGLADTGFGKASVQHRLSAGQCQGTADSQSGAEAPGKSPAQEQEQSQCRQ